MTLCTERLALSKNYHSFFEQKPKMSYLFSVRIEFLFPFFECFEGNNLFARQ